MKFNIGQTVSVRMVVSQIVIREDDTYYVLVPWKDDGSGYLNSTTVREVAIDEYNG